MSAPAGANPARQGREPVPGSRNSAIRGTNKDQRRLIKAIKQAGGEVRPSGISGHVDVYLDGRRIGCLSGSPSDHRTTKNDIARLRRHGLAITSKGTFDGTSA